VRSSTYLRSGKGHEAGHLLGEAIGDPSVRRGTAVGDAEEGEGQEEDTGDEPKGEPA
jgi:hypothetical protein